MELKWVLRSSTALSLLATIDMPAREVLNTHLLSDKLCGPGLAVVTMMMNLPVS
jgi:hypothetical protein